MPAHPHSGESKGASDVSPQADADAAPRLPHERDESTDSGTRPPDPKLEQAAEDAQSSKQQTDKGEVTDGLYERTLRGERGNQSSR